LFLLENGADVNAPPARFNGFTALKRAAERHYWIWERKGEKDEWHRTFNLLLERGARVVRPDGTSGILVPQLTRQIQKDRLRLVLEEGATVNDKQKGETALKIAAERGSVHIVQLLLHYGAVDDDKLPPMDE